MTAMTIASPNSKYTITPTGIEFHSALSLEEWDDLGSKLAPIAKSIGFLMGDWINYGLKAWGEKYKEALAATDIPYKTLANYAYVARKVAPSLREQSLGYEHHAAVAKLKPYEQAHWLGEAKEHGLTIRRLRKSIQLGRLATEEDLLGNASDRGEVTHFLLISSFMRWWTSETSKTPVKEWSQEWRETIKSDLLRIVEIYHQL